MDNNQQWYYTDRNGQQAGPVSLTDLQSLLQQSAVTDSSMVWTEGMDDWKTVSDIDILKSSEGATIPQPAPLAQPAASPLSQPTAASNPYAPPQTQVTAPVSENDYHIPEVKRTNYALMASTLAIGFVLLVIGLIIMGISSPGTYSDDELIYGDYSTTSTTSTEVPTSAIVLIIIGFVGLIYGGILSLIYLHRAWRVIQPGGASTTPGKAVGFLFIPFFNLYWYFVAYWKWSQDWNRVTTTHRKLVGAPTMGEGLFLAYAILNVIGVLINLAGLAGLVFFFIIMWQLCKAVNYMHDLRISNPNQQDGGIKLH